jgi:hypothetical protein
MKKYYVLLPAFFAVCLICAESCIREKSDRPVPSVITDNELFNKAFESGYAWEAMGVCRKARHFPQVPWW